MTDLLNKLPNSRFPIHSFLKKSGEPLYSGGCGSVVCNAGYSSDVTLACEDAQVIQALMDDGSWIMDHG